MQLNSHPVTGDYEVIIVGICTVYILCKWPNTGSPTPQLMASPRLSCTLIRTLIFLWMSLVLEHAIIWQGFLQLTRLIIDTIVLIYNDKINNYSIPMMQYKGFNHHKTTNIVIQLYKYSFNTIWK